MAKAKKNTALGVELRAARAAKGWTLTECGDRCGVAFSTVRNYELGLIRKIEILDKIKKGLGLK